MVSVRMADDTDLVEIVYSDGSKATLQSNPTQIRGLVERSATGRVPLIELKDRHGREVILNADHIREIRVLGGSSHRQAG